MSAQQAIPGMEQIAKRDEGDGLMDVVKRAIFDPTFDAEKLKVLLEVKLKWDAEESRRNFEDAFQAFKRNLPAIFKTKKVSFPTSQGGKTEYSHAELDKITPILTESLLAVGITHQWRLGESNGRTTVTCVLKGFGHAEEAATLAGPPDTSGGKNNVQAIGSTVSYLERYSLLAACGIAAKGMDDDGRKGECMAEQVIDEYCIAMRDCSELDPLKKLFGECWNKAKSLEDRDAQARLQKVYEARKREIWKTTQQ